MPDPHITRKTECQVCKGPMGAIRVHEGSGGKQQYRGRIVQTCNNKGTCHWTYYHTTESYEWVDAEKLVSRVIARETGAPLPPDVLHAPLRLATPHVEALGPVACAGNCRNKSGGLVRGSQQCVDLMCKTCCHNAALDARSANRPRDPCKTHKVPAVSDNPALPPSQSSDNLSDTDSDSSSGSFKQPTPPLHIRIPSVAQRASNSSQTLQIPTSTQTTLPIATQRPPNPSQNPNPLQQVPTLTQTAPPAASQCPPNVFQHLPRVSHGRSTLAQPIGRKWLEAKSAANVEAKALEDVKAKQLQMDDISKRTCQLIIWYKAGSPPVELSHHVPTFPQMQLASVEPLMKDLELTTTSLIDIYTAGSWKTINPSHVFQINKDRQLLLRLRSSLRDELNPEDYPGLTERTKQTRTSGTKRNAELEIVSPMKKPRLTTAEPPNSETPSTFSSSVPIISPNSLSSSSLTASATAAIPPLPAVAELHVVNGIAQVDNIQKLPVASWNEGWNKLNAQIKANHKRDTNEKSLFLSIFGLEYKKTSICKYKKIWKDAPQRLRDHFLRMGNVKGASMLDFSQAYSRGHIPEENIEVVDASVELKSETATTSIIRSAPQSSESSSTPVISSESSTPVVSLESESPSSPAIQSQIPAPFPPLSPLQPQQPLPTKNSTLPSLALIDIVDAYGYDSDDSDSEDNEALCPYCDDPLPSSPSPSLTAHLLRLEPLSEPDPQPSNKNHRKAPLHVYVSLCTRHIFESRELPNARRRGWPLTPNFSDLFSRLESRSRALQRAAQDPDNSFLLEAKNYYKSNPTRLQGASAQLTSSSYGERGYQIIHIAIEHVIPQRIVNLSHIHPLTYRTFLREVLIPEAAILLIREDLKLSKLDAIRVWKESCTFGNGMHPSDDDCPFIEEAQRRVMSHQDQDDEEDLIKHEEMELDPFADCDEVGFQGGDGTCDDPMVIL
ncbi:hypothetical protein H0H93_003063 [Arthromyces matolae]|nr:hypothetical protein H0H93_003063 [Arthromyces matolae]